MDAAVRAGDHMIGIRRVDPKRMIVAMNFGDDIGLEGSAAIVRDKHGRAAQPDALIVVGVDSNLAVVGRPVVCVAHLFPGLAAVLRAKDAALFILDDGINDAGIASVYIDADAAGHAFGQAAREASPVGSAVYGFVQAAVRAASVESERSPAPLVCRCVEGSRALRVNRDIGYSSVFVNKEGPGPGLPSIGCLVDTALLVWPPQVANGGDIYDVGITRIDDDPADVL